jgi:catechol 2,3-dioxygenase-like lactoylglutathione lyase family enzyme
LQYRQKTIKDRAVSKIVTLVAILLSIAGASPDQRARPKIYGIAFVRFKVVGFEKSTGFYSKILGLGSGHEDCRGTLDPCFVVNSSQRIELKRTDSRDTGSFLDEVGYATGDLPGMRSYLAGHNVRATEIKRGQNGRLFFEAEDPEHNRIAFVEMSGHNSKIEQSHQVSNRLIHAGWVVRNLTVEKKFYCDLLGFRLYWYGGFKDEDTDWYEIQVPDGDNWVEFMLNIPAGADHRELGVQNHFSLGVASMKAAVAKLRVNGLLTKDQPEIGRDGKLSFDIYDPDGTRVEFMEPKNAVAPCCHPYTAALPAF